MKKDYLMPICDAHVHVVPQFDDGSQSVDMSLALLAESYRQGVRRIYCTSHSWAYFAGKGDKYDIRGKTFRGRAPYDSAFGALKQEAGPLYPDLELLPGCEVNFRRNNIDILMPLLDVGEIPTMNGTRHVLTEFDPDVIPDDALFIVRELFAHNYAPVIAHAERYERLNLENIVALAALDCKIQINLFSLADEPNAAIKEKAETYCHNRLVTFVGTDAHRTNHRPPVVTSGVQRLFAVCEEQYVADICRNNALKML